MSAITHERPTTVTDTAVSVDNLTVQFSSKRGDVTALSDVDVKVGKGEFVSIAGPSGCGKSTLLKVVAGLTGASRGSVELAGREVKGPQRNIGYVFQRAALLEWRTVRKNILLQGEMRGMNKKAAAAKADQLIEMTGLTGFEGALPHELSGGMQQRVSLCRALLHEPEVLLMDEPFRRPRRPHPRQDERRTAPHLAGDRNDGHAGHPLSRRGRLPRQPGGGHEPEAGADRRHPRRGPPGATGVRRDDGEAGVHQRCQHGEGSVGGYDGGGLIPRIGGLLDIIVGEAIGRSGLHRRFSTAKRHFEQARTDQPMTSDPHTEITERDRRLTSVRGPNPRPPQQRDGGASVTLHRAATLTRCIPPA
ncbi:MULTISPECIES: ABC transporter ATP-binding protein [Nocardiaceae]|uniref:ABC-type lipoprotein export system ATPase subunit n=1 Tax=Rhodococcoides corynebacterioides TaxID=53972 RepID=A0ABS2KV61_9NOCA|nr:MULTISPECIES: ATP-binding cassette domain-containing protein [Rhodococcus]MBM7415826.1 ABC-type lipoprotein export system ATPase subunit [Rhodococcus corynebacterioides]MBP1118288.1 ABC-type lipoprotein export system ATPase subunit [Rhodococcus sp. PvP016]